MKIFDLIKLGHAHIYVHKKQSFLTVLSTGILFGVLLGVVFLFNGLENLFIRASETLSGKEVYVVSSSCTSNGNCLQFEDMQSLAARTARPYGGEVNGKLEVYNYKNGGATFRVISEDYVKNLIEIDLGKYESGTLFKLISLDEAEELIKTGGEENPDEMTFVSAQKVYSISEISDLKSKVLGKEFIESYLVPTVSLESEEETAVETETPAEIAYERKELHYIVAGVVGTSKTSLSLAKGYGDIKFLDFFLDRVDSQVAMTDLFVSRDTDASENFKAIFEASDEDYSLPIIRFSNLEAAYEYYENENCNLERNLGRCSSYTVAELVGNRLQTKDALETVYLFFRYGGLVLLLIAVAISVATFIRLLSENARSIALYRSLGASGLDILFIHFSYLVELCLITVLFAVILGADIATMISLKDAELLSGILTSIYSRSIDSGILIGLSFEVTEIILAVLATAPLCLILTLDQLSSKNLAKKIKE